MQSLFNFVEYREYLNDLIESKGTSAYGLKGRWAKALNVSSSLMSQILSGKKTLTPDQTSDLCDHLGLNPLEADYLHLLVEWDRAGSSRYRAKLEKKIRSLKAQAKQVRQRVPKFKELADPQKAIYYSSWLYTGIRNLTALESIRSLEDLAAHLKIEPEVAARVLRFLIDNRLCVEEEDGSLTYGPSQTHVDSESPFVNKHHQNWRFQAIHHMELKKSNDLFFTSPMSLSKEAFEEIRNLLPTTIQDVYKISGPSDSEVTACLNIDLFNY